METYTLSNTALSTLCRELALLLHAGVSAGDGLALLSEEGTGAVPVSLLRTLSEQVDAGTALSDALRGCGCFPTYLYGLLAVGEQSGRTEEALCALADYYEERDRMDHRLRAALLYPSILLLIMLAVIVVLLTQVLPVFNESYAHLGGQLTGLAGSLLALGRLLNRGMPVLCALLAIAVLFLTAFSGSASFRTRILALWRASYGDKGISHVINTARFAQALSMGLSSGLTMEESLSLSSALLEDIPAAKARCKDCLTRLDDGKPLTQAMDESGLLSTHDCRLLELGMRSGSGDTAMGQIARRLEEDSELALEALVGRIEPALVLVTSLLVGIILLSVMLPLMHIMSAIG